MKYRTNNLAASLLCSVGSVAIIAGGMIAAFSANAPSREAMWLSAYLVLVVGVIQIAIGVGFIVFVKKELSRRLLIAPLTLFNLGNAAVIVHTLAPANSALGHISIIDLSGLVIGSIPDGKAENLNDYCKKYDEKSRI